MGIRVYYFLMQDFCHQLHRTSDSGGRVSEAFWGLQWLEVRVVSCKQLGLGFRVYGLGFRASGLKSSTLHKL